MQAGGVNIILHEKRQSEQERITAGVLGVQLSRLTNCRMAALGHAVEKGIVSLYAIEKMTRQFLYADFPFPDKGLELAGCHLVQFVHGAFSFSMRSDAFSAECEKYAQAVFG